jgi:putative N6-adenine-specific DNA methylase
LSEQAFFAPCPRGLEGVLCAELAGLGARRVAPSPGGAGFRGPFALCYRVNLESRIASRVLWRLTAAPYRREEDIYRAAKRLNWPGWFAPACTIKVKVSARHCPLPSLDFLTLRIKDAVCDKFVAVRQPRPSVDTRLPDIRIDAFVTDQEVTFYLDTSGEPLFKRGLRQARAAAPLRENLAAGILHLAGWTPAQPLLDPMCGSGTILLEAAQIARGIAPGLGRRFAFEKLRGFDQNAWQAIRRTSRARQREQPGAIYGCDLDAEALEATRANLCGAGLEDAVHLRRADVLELTAPAADGVLVANPPYGVRSGDEQELAEFYPRLGDVLKQQFAGWRAYVFTADQRLPGLIGLAPSRRIPLYNGALECRLYEFLLVVGSARRLRKIKQAQGGAG